MLEALLMLVRQPKPRIEIQYPSAVRPEGNLVAQRLLERVSRRATPTGAGSA